MRRYYGNFKGVEDLWREFEITEADVRDEDIVWAYYDLDGYEGTARVILQRDGRLYEVRESHCSWFGLGRGWRPAEVSRAQLALRPAEAQVDDRDVTAIEAWTEMVRRLPPPQRR